MKKTDLEKQKALKLMGKTNATLPPGRFGGDAAIPDRRQQRQMDKAAGLVPFAVKLPQTLVDALRAKAEADGVAMNELVDALLTRALKD